MGRRLLKLGLCLASAPTARGAEPLRVTVPGTPGMQCQAYFHSPDRAIRYPLVLSLKGTGIYTTARSAEVELALRGLYASGRITVVTIDKPGIVEDAGRAIVDDSSYNRYVQEDLIRCSEAALQHAIEHATGVGPILISAHSEGAQVAARLLADAQQRRDPLASRVKALFLSGLPLTDWRSLLAGQLADAERQRFFVAFERRDDAVLRTFGNLTTAYLARAFADEPLGKTFERLGRLGSDAEFHVYQGLADRNTPASAVRELEARELRERRLNLKTRYYPTGHALSRAAVLDIARDISAWIGTWTAAAR